MSVARRASPLAPTKANVHPEPQSPSADAGFPVSWPRAGGLALALGVAYANSLRVPFLLDDPRPGVPIDQATRKLVWASFELNRALSGADPWSFHVFNLLAHLACAALLFGLLRRAIAMTVPARGWRARDDLAFVSTLLWAVHPLQTGAVTYLSQRAETLGALFYLGVVYAFVRAVESPRRLAWYGLALASLVLGFLTKETIATVPLVVLAFDAVFLARGWRAALARRGAVHAVLGLATVGLALVFVAPLLGASGSTAGFGVERFGPLAYARTQAGVLLHYLRLALWPDPLCFDYGWPIAESPAAWVPQGLLVIALLATTLAFLRKGSWIGFAGLFFFVYLGPTSSFVPIQDPAFEHRMYLPLMSVVVLGVSGVGWILRRLGARRGLSVALVALCAMALVARTVRRNQDYRSALELWRITVAQAPHNTRARANLAAKWLDQGEPAKAAEELEQALALGLEDGFARLNLGNAYLALGEVERALPHLERAVELRDDPRCPDALGKALLLLGDAAGAARNFERALARRPEDPGLHYRLACALAQDQRPEAALAQCREALRLEPDYREARLKAAALLAALGREDEARAEVLEAGVGKSDSARDQDRLGRTLFLSSDWSGAIAAFEQALALQPDEAGLHYRLGAALLRAGRADEARKRFDEALALDPSDPDTHLALAELALGRGQNEAALEHLHEAEERAPDSATRALLLGRALRALGRDDEALAAFRRACELDPASPDPLAAFARAVCARENASPAERREALERAERACRLAGEPRADLLETQALACAGLGQLERAVELLEQALLLPGPTRNADVAERLRARRDQYRAQAR